MARRYPEKAKRRIGSSESRILFGKGFKDQTTLYLYNVKNGIYDEETRKVSKALEDRLRRGNIFESAVAQVAMLEEDIELHKVHRYVEHPRPDMNEIMGCEMDYEIVNHPDGPAICEVKWVSEKYYRTWDDGSDGGKIPPLGYQIQLQHQLACSPSKRWGKLSCGIGHDGYEAWNYPRHEPLIGAIEHQVKKFMALTEPPPPDYGMDADMLIALNQTVDMGLEIDCPDERTAALCERYDKASKWESACKKTKKEAKAEILEHIGEAAKVRLPEGGKISTWGVSEREIPATTRSAFRGFRVTYPKENQDVTAR